MKNSYIKYSDIELVELLRSSKTKSERAFTVLYERYAAHVRAYCKNMIKNADAAEDIFQETFIRFYKSLNTDFKVINVPAYLIKIARNLALNYFRDKKQMLQVEEVHSIFDSDNNYEQKELLEIVMKALDLLDFKYKEAFVLRKIDGFSLQEIADALEISVEGAKTRVNRARIKLMEILQPYLKDLSY